MAIKNICVTLRVDQVESIKELPKSFNVSKFIRECLDEYIQKQRNLQLKVKPNDAITTQN